MNLKILGSVIIIFGAYCASFCMDPDDVIFAPASWGALSLSIWLLFIICRGWESFGPWDKYQLLWAAVSNIAFFHFLRHDPSFLGWGDVYFFCGNQLEYCTCDFRWNLAGWMKATILWNFVLTAALGAQRLAIQVGLDGLLPGEEVVTKESFISICWRLIPYWLNNWEQQWGAECSSMMFELPHFAVELLVILPCVQILCSRMKILAVPIAALPAGGGIEQPDGVERENYAPNILKGFWEHKPEQRRLLPRMRANSKLMMFTVTLATFAAFNALCVPLHLEHQITLHHSTTSIKLASIHVPWEELRKGSVQPSWELLSSSGITNTQHLKSIMGRLSHFRALSSQEPHSAAINSTEGLLDDISSSDLEATADFSNRVQGITTMIEDVGSSLEPSSPDEDGEVISNISYRDQHTALDSNPEQISKQNLTGHLPVKHQSRCSGFDKLILNINKHAEEIRKMQDIRHIELIPLVESALAIMRLSCEKFFVLISVFVSFILFKEPPPLARRMIRLNARLSTIFQKVILYSFPAVCWVYGAGFIFSTFVSVVFWGAPILSIYHLLRSNASTISIKALKPATLADIERMGGNCAICWDEMSVPGAMRDEMSVPGAKTQTAVVPAPSPSQSCSHDEAECPQAAPADAAPSSDAAVAVINPPGSGSGCKSVEDGQWNPASASVGKEKVQNNASMDSPSGSEGSKGEGVTERVEGAAAAQVPGSKAAEQQESVGVEVVSSDGFSLSCSHAYHHACLHQWMHQCHAQGTTPKCPMCQAVIKLEVNWRFPIPWKRLRGPAEGGAQGQAAAVAAPAAAGGEQMLMNPNNAANPDELQMLRLLDHQRELQEMLRDMPQILPPEGVMVMQGEPPQQQFHQLQQERQHLLRERNELVVRRRLLQQQLDAQRRQLVEAQAEFRQQELQLQQLEGDIRELQNLRQAIVEPEDAGVASTEEVPFAGLSNNVSEDLGVSMGGKVDGLSPSASTLPEVSLGSSGSADVHRASAGLQGLQQANQARKRSGLEPEDECESTQSFSSQYSMQTTLEPSSHGVSSLPISSTHHGQEVFNSPPG